MASVVTHNSNRLAKNTFALYVRMGLAMLVGLYTSRIVLQALGVESYGVYNVVGGVVTFLGFFNSSMSTSTTRYLSAGMVEHSPRELKEVFSTSVNAHVLIGLITVILLETVGLWFVINKLVIPSDQRVAALWVYQCSIVSFFISIISTPYNAAIISNEKMSAYAWISILEILLKLGVAFIVLYSKSNKLIIYSILILSVSILMRLIYGIYCGRHFPECRYIFCWNRSLIKGMLSFSGWMMFGCVTDILGGQGVNILINMFFGPIFNASRGIAVQVQTSISQFSNNFLTSVNPQVIKTFVAKEYDYCFKLIYASCKISFCLMLILIIPVILYSSQILSLWLTVVPEDASIFLNLMLIDCLIRSIYTPVAPLSQATGNVRPYQLAISILFLANFVITYILFKVGFPVYATFVLSAILSFIGVFVRVWVLNRQVSFPFKEFITKVILPIFIVASISFFSSGVIAWILEGIPYTMILSMVLSMSLTLIFIWVMGLNKFEREVLSRQVISIMKKIFRR